MATKTRTTTDAVELLKQDHEKVKGLFRKFSETGDGAIKTRQRIADQIFEELAIHTRVEEEIFYPAVRKATDEEGIELLDEAEEEHHVVDLIIAELKQMDPSHDHYAAKMTVLCENVEHHIKEEEEEMLPDAEKRIKDQLETLGQRILDMKQSAAATS
jgi:lysyl-tRNA synthetase class II